MSGSPTTDSIRSAEHREFDRFSAYLEKLDKAGWAENSYSSDWPVLRVVSHISSNAVINGGRFATWFQGVPALTRDDFQKIWSHFDSLNSEQMLPEFRKAHNDYFKIVDTLTAEQGATEVESFAGKLPANRSLLGRLSELTLHAWDVMVARDRNATLPKDATEALISNLRLAALDAQRAEKLAGKKVQFNTTEPGATFVLDFSGEKAAIAEGSTPSPDLALELPAEEFYRLIYGRQFVPGAPMRIKLLSGSADDQAALLKAFR